MVYRFFGRLIYEHTCIVGINGSSKGVAVAFHNPSCNGIFGEICGVGNIGEGTASCLVYTGTITKRTIGTVRVHIEAPKMLLVCPGFVVKIYDATQCKNIHNLLIGGT